MNSAKLFGKFLLPFWLCLSVHQLGVLAAGSILVAIQGNSPYFPRYQGVTSVSYLYLWLVICGVVCGILGGIFGRLLAKGIAGLSPEKWRGWVRQHPIYIALLLGLVFAALLEWK
ncbi:predicted chloride channel protein [Haemophilus influenzae R3021]|uniref:Predicted chloride channel protein n=1 Tax=Haemophilus influenzae R3021 TaxID=375432 RepID=A4N773_HAEIF|nr:chloride channel protein [Haemophilus influenzae]EDJ89918.1 predicted chloride channel protein [Haemophilus influenzae R3021]